MKMAISAAIAACFALSLGSAPASAQETMPPSGERPVEHRPMKPNPELLGVGVGVFAAAYIPGVLVAMQSDRDGDGWLYAPVIGPWVDLFDREGCGQGCGYETINKLLLIGSGVAQAVGVGAVVASFLVPER